MNASKPMMIGYFKTTSTACRDRLTEIVFKSGGSMRALSATDFVAHWDVVQASEKNDAVRAIASIREEGLSVSGGVDMHEPMDPSQSSILDPRRLRRCTERSFQLAQLAVAERPEILMTAYAIAHLGLLKQSGPTLGQVQFAGVAQPVEIYRMPSAA